MGQYKANSTNSQNFSLKFENQTIGELIYKKWYSFNAKNGAFLFTEIGAVVITDYNNPKIHIKY